MAYLNHIKRISTYITKSLVYAKVLKNIILPFFNPVNTYKRVYT
jgi:hypothetical protein